MASGCGKKMRKYGKGGDVSEAAENEKLAAGSMNEEAKKNREEARENEELAVDFLNQKTPPSRGPTSRRRANRENRGYAEGGPISDEERYGKTGAEIRRLDPEAYKNRKDKSAAANIALLKQLREKDKAAQKSTRVESAEESMRTGKPMKDSGFTAVRAPSSGPTTRGGKRRPAPAAPVARPSQGASRREFGQDLRGPKYSGKDIQTAEKMGQATLLGLTAGRAGSLGSFNRAVAAPAKAASRTAKATEAATKARQARTAKAAAERKAAEAAELERRRRTLSGSNVGGQGNRPTINRLTGGSIKKYAAGGAVRGDGICRVKTKGRMR